MDRRAFLYGTMASLGTALLVAPARTRAATADPVEGLRGSIDAGEPGVVPVTADDRSAELQSAAEKAAAEGRPLFLPAGRFLVSNLVLPNGLTLIGVPGQTRLVYGGGGRLVSALGGRRISIDGVIFDGANRELADATGGLIDFTEVEDLDFSRSEIIGSAGHALTLARVSGRVAGSRFSGARGVAVVSTEGRGLDIADNQIADCGTGGVLIERWSDGDDATTVSGNRIERIRLLEDAAAGRGAGVEIVRAPGVTVSGNRIADCAGNAVLVTAASGVAITGNRCQRSGGVAISAGDASDGAMIASNVIEGAAGGLVLTGGADSGRLAAITGNMVRDIAAGEEASTAGIGIHVDADAAVTGNVVEAAERIGLRLGWGASLRNVVASANVIRNSALGIGISVVEGVGHTVVTSNMITAARDGGIRGLRWLDPVTGELTVADAGAYPGLVIEKNQVG
jgi:uncharacterized secreted repeat protein (TIGR03808 family)